MRSHTRRLFRGPSSEIREGESPELSGLIQNVFDESLFTGRIECAALCRTHLTCRAEDQAERKNEPFMRVDLARRFIHGFLGFESDEPQHREQKCRVVGDEFARREEPREKGRNRRCASLEREEVHVLVGARVCRIH